jgi:hypothetical protein
MVNRGPVVTYVPMETRMVKPVAHCDSKVVEIGKKQWELLADDELEVVCLCLWRLGLSSLP